MRKVARRYLCYVLISQQPGFTNKVYIGVTNNLKRRIRQHNGELKTGGAKYTRLYRPWFIAATVQHFKTERQALQFEWAWQHPDRTRHLKEHRRARLINNTRSFPNYLQCASYIVQSREWSRGDLKLCVHYLPNDLRERLEQTLQMEGKVFEEALCLETANQ